MKKLLDRIIGSYFFVLHVLAVYGGWMVWTRLHDMGFVDKLVFVWKWV